jgi:hypothetical protein
MRRWELWVGEGGTSFFPDDDDQARSEAARNGYSFGWETTAAGRNSAMRLMYEHLGYGEYQPMLRDDGTRYPEDEDDGYQGATTR